MCIYNIYIRDQCITHMLVALVAQRIEHLTSNEGVVGSIPTRRTINAPVAQWLEQDSYKVKVGGSSPPGSTNFE